MALHLPAGWRETTLGKIMEISSGKSRPKNSGSFPVYGGNGILDYADQYNFEGETIIIGRVGAYCGATYFENKNFRLSDNALGIKSNEKSNIKFLYYFLINQNLNKKAIGGAQPLLTQGILNGIEVAIPSDIKEQVAIASLLSSFDDKIELLREQNKTLETLGQTIFQEWFGKYSVDDPENLPDGWRVGKLGEVVELLNGFAFKSSTFDPEGRYGLVTISNVQDGYFIETTKDKLNKIPEKMYDYCFLKTGDILLSLTGNVGRVCHVIGSDYLLNQRVAKLQSKKINNYGYIYMLFRQQNLQHQLESISSGTAQQNLSPIKTADLEIVIPSDEKIKKFGDIVNPFIDKMLKNKTQIQSLSKTRDTMLPKLMSGEVRVEF